MPQPLILIIDQGTFSTRALVFDTQGQIRATAARKITLTGHGTDKVEQDAAEIMTSVQQVVDEVLQSAIVKEAEVMCAGLTTQRSSVVAWDRRSGQPLAPLLSWQDRRVATWLQQFEAEAAKVKELTGLRLSPHYGAGKLRWYLDHVPAVSQAYTKGYLAFGPLAAFILFNLLKDRPLAVDHVNASRTQLWNLASRDWDPWLLPMFDVPPEALPACQPTLYAYGQLAGAGIPLTVVNGDQNAAIYSLGRPQPGTAIVNIGTGAFILQLTGADRLKHPALLTALGSSTAQTAEYLIEGTVNGAGAALDWATAQWHLPRITRHLDDWLMRPEEPLIFINTIGGLGSPWWKPGPEPGFLGEGEPWQKGVAVAESILFMLYANLQAMTAAGLPISRLQISGGLARIDPLCQRLANLTERPVYRPVETEATARGAAWLALGQPDVWPEPSPGQTFLPQPNPDLHQRYERFRDVLG